MMSPYRTVDLSKLSPGDTLVEPVFSDGLTKLLGSGCAVSEQLIKRLAARGVTEVVVQIPAERVAKLPRSTPLPAARADTQSIVGASRLVEHSCHCGSVIAIQAPVADLAVAAWFCQSCGAVYFGGVDSSKNHGIELLTADDNHSLGGDRLSESTRESNSDNVEAIKSVSSEGTPAGRDRRQQTRYSIGVPVVAVPLRTNFSIAGTPVQMTTRDISPSGIALAHTRFCDSPYYVIDFTSAGIELLQVLLRVLRVSNCGPTYEVAGKFISRLHCASWHNKS
jgi:hypothetical protein